MKLRVQWRPEIGLNRRGQAWQGFQGLDGEAYRARDGKAFMMDMTWITDRIAVGGAIWRTENMAEVVRAGITHILDMQIEFDDTPLAGPYGIAVLWNPVDDDFQPKSADVFRRGVEFARQALDEPEARVYVHCAAGVHRAPMMTLAILCSMGWELGEAMQTIQARRPVVDFADVYVDSVKSFLQEQVETSG